jgi:hypothetical protein
LSVKTAEVYPYMDKKINPICNVVASDQSFDLSMIAKNVNRVMMSKAKNSTINTLSPGSINVVGTCHSPSILSILRHSMHIRERPGVEL